MPNLTRIFSMVIQLERQYIGNDDAKILANSTDHRRPQGQRRGGYSSNYNNRNSSKVCTHCAGMGTLLKLVTKYMIFHQTGKSPLNLASNSGSESYEQKGNEDFKAPAPTLTREQYDKLVNLLQSTTVAQPSASTSQVNLVTQYGTTSFEKPKSGISHVFSSLSSSCLGSWIIDSGASDHICFSLKCFTNYEPIEPVNVKLPNGQFSIAK